MRESMWPEITKLPKTRKPEDIIREQCDMINDEYKDILTARILKTDKSLAEYTQSPLMTIENYASILAAPRTVQSLLGETDNDKSITYELYITSPIVPTYKYRILFLQHGLVAYPTYLYLESIIEKELGINAMPYKIETEDEFIDLLTNILGSKRVADVLTRIISYND